MNFGATAYFTGSSMAPTELALALGDRGFESLWASGHSHLPKAGRADYPGHGTLSEMLIDVMDPFVTLTVAMAARALNIGTGNFMRRIRAA